MKQESKRGERVFDEKVKLYQSILTTLEDIIKDDQITKSEFSRLPFPMMRVQMLGGDDTIEAFERIYQQLNAVFERDEENDEVEITDDEKEDTILNRQGYEKTEKVMIDLFESLDYSDDFNKINFLDQIQT